MDKCNAGHLKGQRVLVTRAIEQSGGLVTCLKNAGAEPVLFPTIVVRALKAPSSFSAIATNLAQSYYDGILFTSHNAVRHFSRVSSELILDAAHLVATTRCFVVGEATKAAVHELLGQRATVAKVANANGLLDCLGETLTTLAGRRFLFPRPKNGRPELITGLHRAKAHVDTLELYETVAYDQDADGDQDALGKLPKGLDWITFLSPSAVTGFLTRAQIPNGVNVICIGTTTAQAACDAGISVDVISPEQTVEALVRSMVSASKVVQ